jgi:acetaldehyde dehydrogenase (acetylating)
LRQTVVTTVAESTRQNWDEVAAVTSRIVDALQGLDHTVALKALNNATHTLEHDRYQQTEAAYAKNAQVAKVNEAVQGVPF